MEKTKQALLMIGIMITTIFSTISVSAINKELEIIEKNNGIINNEEQPIQAIVVVEQIDGRSWNIELWAYNTYDEDVTIFIGPYSANTYIDPEGSEFPVFSRPKESFFVYIWWIIPLKYPQKKEVPAHDKILLDEYTFDGKSNIPIWARLIYGIPKILPEGNYQLFARIMYKYKFVLQNAFSDEINIHLDAP